MSPERFDQLLSQLTLLISKKGTKFRKSILLNERLAVTLRFLASGESQNLHYLFSSDWEELQSQRLFLSVVKLLTQCCPRNIHEVPNDWRRGKQLHNNLKIHRICRTSLAQSMGNMFELNVQKTLEASTRTTRYFLALFNQLSSTLITALRCPMLVNMPVITIAASLFTATWEDILKITQIISLNLSELKSVILTLYPISQWGTKYSRLKLS